MSDERRPNIVVAEKLSDDAMRRLAEVGEIRLLESCGEDALIAAVADCDALLVRTYSQVTAEVIEAGERLKVIGRAGVGVENIDLDAARTHGVTVVHTPAASTDAVAEHTVGLMLALERHLMLGDAMVRDGRFAEARARFISRELHTCTLGIVGMGRIGRAVARICVQGLRMRVVYNDIREVGPFEFPATALAKDQLYAEADVVSLHVPLTDETRGMIDCKALERFKKSATLINTSRGAVVSAVDLASALRQGRVAGAGIDVFDDEPPAADHALLEAPRVLLSPHVAGRTAPAIQRMNAVVDDVLAVLAGRPPIYPCSPSGRR